MDVAENRAGLCAPSILLLSLSFVSLVLGVVAAAAHYLHWAWGNPWQPIGWLLSLLFLLLAFSPSPRQIVASLGSVLKPKAAFFVFWILVFVVSHLWNFSTAPWNGNGLFDESGWDLWFLKSYVIGHPFQPAWFHPPISRETLFHYYVWGFLRLFGFNILSYEAALFVIWCTTFVFTLLLIDLFFRSYIVDSLAALVFSCLPFAFIYTFAGYRYPMATALCVVSLYFLHLGFKRASSFYLTLGGVAAGLCLASSISGKQYLLALLLFAVLYIGLHWRSLNTSVKWAQVAIIVYGLVAAAMPILCYILFNRAEYTFYEGGFIHSFWQAICGNPFPTNVNSYTKHLWDCFFSVPGPRFFIPDALPIPLAYYCFLLPGIAVAVGQKRYEIVLLATIPVVGAFIATSYENRLLLAIPFWVILMGFTAARLLKLKLWSGGKILLWGVSAFILILGLLPSIRYIHKKTKDPFSIRHYAQDEVAVARFLRSVVAGKVPSNPPRLEHDEFNRVEGVPDAPYETFICQNEAYSIIHLFLHDYHDAKILSFCGGAPMIVMTEQEVWSANKEALLTYTPSVKGLKLIWEKDPKTDRIIRMLEPLRSLGTGESISYSFAGKERKFYVLNIPGQNIAQFQEDIRNLSDSLF
jgi:hypothetical protein